MVYRFLDLELDVGGRTLRRGRRPVRLEPRAFDLLAYLVRHRDRVVPRDELFAVVWQGLAVSDAALSRAVMLVRRAVGDRRRGRTVVQTYHRRGFRFVAPAVVADAAPDGGDRLAFAGRTAEMARLLAAWERARSGRRAFVAVHGEPGIGKTRLLSEFAARVAPATVLAGRCDPYVNGPFEPIRQALEAFVAGCPPADVVRRLGGGAAELARIAPVIRRLHPRLARSAGASPDVERLRLFDAVARWLAAAAATAPVLLLLDDMQWASVQTFHLVRHVVRATADARLLVVAAYRDTEIAPGHPVTAVLGNLAGRSEAESLALGGLSPAEVATLLEAEAGGAWRASAAALSDRTGGNPLFLTHIVRHCRPGDAALPDSVRAAVARRVAALSEAAGRTLSLAAVVGGDVEFALLAAVAETAEDRVLDGLREAAAAGLVAEVAPGRWRFTHDVVRESLADAVGAEVRERLHDRIGGTLEARAPASVEAGVEALAFHFGEAAGTRGDAGKAIAWATRAAEQAAASLAHDEAVRHYRRALALADARSEDGALRLALWIRLGEAERDAGDPGYRETLLAAAAEADARGDWAQLTRAALANSRGWASAVWAVDRMRVTVLERALARERDEGLRTRLLAALASELVFSTAAARAVALADEALANARRLGDTRTVADVLRLRCYVHATPDTLAERALASTEILAAGDRLDDPQLRFWALVMRTEIATQMGDRLERERQLVALGEVADELGTPVARWAVLRMRAETALLAGATAEAEALVSEARAVGVESGQPDAERLHCYQLWGVRRQQGRLAEFLADVERYVRDAGEPAALRAWLADTYVAVGRREAAARSIETSAAAGFADQPYDGAWLTTMVYWARVAAALGASGAAAVLFDRLAPWHDRVEATGGVVNGAVAHVLGRLAAVLGRLDDALAHLAEAETVHARLGSPHLLAETRLAIAETLRRRGARGDAERAATLTAATMSVARAYGFRALEARAAGS